MSQAARRKLVVTIDGPAGAGKSTVARLLAHTLGYALLDTGAIYRAVALRAREQGIDWGDEAAVAQVAEGLDIDFVSSAEGNRVRCAGRDVSVELRTPEISRGASIVSAHPRVRAALLDLQRRAGQGGGIVAEGRDLGTVVFPDADAKFFLTASVEERTRRRSTELAARGLPGERERTRSEILERDARDRLRAVAPLRPAADAVSLDSGGKTPEEVVGAMLEVVRARGG